MIAREVQQVLIEKNFSRFVQASFTWSMLFAVVSQQSDSILSDTVHFSTAW